MWVLILTFYTHVIHFMSPHRRYLSGAYSLKTPIFCSKYQSAGNVPHIFMTLWRFKNRFSQANTRTRGKGLDVAETWTYVLLISASSVVFENIKLHQTVCVTYTCWHAWWSGGMWTVAKKKIQASFLETDELDLVQKTHTIKSFTCSLLFYIVWSKLVTQNNLTDHIDKELSTR